MRMGEKEHIAKQDAPYTRETLAQDFAALGVATGDVILVHTAFGTVGFIAGSQQALMEGLADAVGPAGTIVMTAQTGLSDPAEWVNPPVPESWWDVIRKSIPAFDLASTPSRGQGLMPEYFRTLPGVVRSDHPAVSFTARGPHAKELMAGHTLKADLGDASPLGKMVSAGAKILLIGVDYEPCTAMHLAEDRAQAAPIIKCGAPMMVNGAREWVWYEGLDGDNDDFAACGNAFEAAHPEFVRIGNIGSAESRLVEMNPLVEFAANWFTENREVLA